MEERDDVKGSDCWVRTRHTHMHTEAQSLGSLLSPTSKTTGWRHSHGSVLVPLSPCGKAEAHRIRRATSPECISQRTSRWRQSASSCQWPGYPNDHLSSVDHENSGAVTFCWLPNRLLQAIFITSSTSQCTCGIFVESLFTAGEPSGVFCTWMFSANRKQNSGLKYFSLLTD